jgi:hypothetical protein
MAFQQIQIPLDSPRNIITDDRFVSELDQCLALDNISVTTAASKRSFTRRRFR